MSRGKFLIFHHPHLSKVAEVFTGLRRVIALVLFAFVVLEDLLIFPSVNIGLCGPFVPELAVLVKHLIVEIFIHAPIIAPPQGIVNP